MAKSELKSNNRSINVSCRMDKAVYNLLMDDSLKKGISINSLMNSICKNYVTWERIAKEIGYAPLTKRTIKKIFNHLDEKTIDQIGNEIGSTVPREIIFLAFNEVNFENIIHTIEINGCRFGTVRHIVKDHTHNINIHHGISEKFSRFLMSMHVAMAKNLDFDLIVNNADKTSICMNIVDGKNN